MFFISLSVVISFPKSEIEHYEFKSQMKHTNDRIHAEMWDKTSTIFFGVGEGRGDMIWNDLD